MRSRLGWLTWVVVAAAGVACASRPSPPDGGTRPSALAATISVSASVSPSAPSLPARSSASAGSGGSSNKRATLAPAARPQPEARKPPSVPQPLAPLGPYPELAQAVPADCASPHVLAASAPLKMLERSDWFWPWVVQALLAHDHVFQLVRSLDDELATSRAVQLQELTVAGTAGKSNLALDVRCRNRETCSDVARVLRAVVPGNAAKVACDPAAGSATSRNVAVEKAALLPSADESVKLTDSGSACARVSACRRHEDEHADVSWGLKCQAAPSKFPARCAAQYTCYDVARCAGAASSSSPVFSPFDDLFGQVGERGQRLGRGRYVADPMGGGGLDPAVLSSVYFYDGELTHGAWATLLMEFSVDDRDPTEGYYKSGLGSWSPAFVEPNGVTRLGPWQQAPATYYNAVGLPGGPNEPGAFDYDGDGRAELLLPVYSVEHANSGTLEYRIWTRRGVAVERYPGTDALPIVGFADVDGDDRPDLFLDYDGSLDQSGTHSSRRPEGWTPAHSLRNGTFSTTDKVAKSYKP